MEFKELLEKALAKDEGVPQLSIHSLKELPCSEPGQNFMSVVNLVQVEGKLPNGDIFSKSVFVKRPTPPADHNQLFSIDDAFSNEVLMYQTVLPLVAAVADVTRVACPRYYHVSRDIIVLEDLRAQGYGVGEAAVGFDISTIRCILKELARFHAASYHTTVVQTERFFDATKTLKPLGMILSNYRPMLEASLKRAIRYLGAKDEFKKATSFLRTLSGKITEEMRKFRSPRNVAVLIQGDFWFNNILTRKNRDAKVSEDNQIRIIDFQGCALLSPAVDFWLVLYTSITPSLLENNCDSFIHLYSSTFVEVLNNQKTPVANVPKTSALEEELSTKELYGFLAAIAYLPVLYLKKELIAEMEKVSVEEKQDEGFLDGFLTPEFSERLNELAIYCVKKGLL